MEENNTGTSTNDIKKEEQIHINKLENAIKKKETAQNVEREKIKNQLRKLLHTALLREYNNWLTLFFERIKGIFTSDEFVKEETGKLSKSTRYLPLTVAALKGNTTSLDILLENDALIEQPSNIDPRGDTVLHSLARFAPTNEKEKEKIMISVEHLGKHYWKKYTESAWLLQNKENMTVLNVATAAGAVDIVQYIIEEQNERCTPNSDEKEYFEYHDFSLIDDVANKTRCIESMDEVPSSCCCPTRLHSAYTWLKNRWRCNIKGFSYSLFEMLFISGIDTEKVVAILNIKSVEEILKAKWNNCKWYLVIWAIIHFVIMIIVTRYAVVHSDVVVDEDSTTEELVYKILTTIFGVAYSIIATLAILNKVFRPQRKQHFLHNILFIIFLFVFGFCSMFHAVYHHAIIIMLVITVVTGWFFMTFFLMPFKYFSFFNEMLKRVFMHIFVPYSILFTLNLISFTATMYVLLNTKENTYRFVDVLFTMFKLMIGLSEVDEIENANFILLTYFIYIVFVVLTFIFLMNALIAAMGTTFEYYSTDGKYRQLSLEKLSAILFLDDTILFLSKKLVNEKPRSARNCCCFNNKISDVNKNRRNEKTKEIERYILKIPLYEKLEYEENTLETEDEDSDDEIGGSNIPNSSHVDHSESHIYAPQNVLVSPESNSACKNFFFTNKSGQLLATFILHQSYEDASSVKNDEIESFFDIETNSPKTIRLQDPESRHVLSIVLEMQKVSLVENVNETYAVEPDTNKGDQNRETNDTKNVTPKENQDDLIGHPPTATPGNKANEGNQKDKTNDTKNVTPNENQYDSIGHPPTTTPDNKANEGNQKGENNDTENVTPKDNPDDSNEHPPTTTPDNKANEGIQKGENNDTENVTPNDNPDDSNEHPSTTTPDNNTDKGDQNSETKGTRNDTEKENPADSITPQIVHPPVTTLGNDTEQNSDKMVKRNGEASDDEYATSSDNTDDSITSTPHIGRSPTASPVLKMPEGTKQYRVKGKRQGRKDKNLIVIRNQKKKTYDSGIIWKYYRIGFKSQQSAAAMYRLANDKKS